ncbi:MAG: gliding motility-associated C-terminal domain-containing protein [Saprospiraceae bacterium]|nr:gliding motility-associated C-terminal domain-containing protein [Saprospiraceae bacterium]
MKTTVRLIFLWAFWALLAVKSFATHNRAGEIIVEQINGCSSNTVRATIRTYTKTSSENADRDSLLLCWGDAAKTCVQVPRMNGNQPDPNFPPIGQPLENDVKRNIYVAEFTYDGPGRYTISMTDPNRNEFILNVNPPASDAVKFHLQTTFTLFNGQFEGCNRSPILEVEPIRYACKGETFIHNPGAFDPDGDLLTYELIVPMQGPNSPVPNYIWPQNVGNSGCCLDINNQNGTITWNTPQVLGEYNIAMIIISWRNGVPIDTMVRDMQILVEECMDNKAPVIAIENTTICVVAGEVVEFTVTATDPNPGDKIKLSALGQPFNMEISPAENVEDWRLSPTPAAEFQTQPVTKTFRWRTTCEHISDLPYTVVFTAEDDFVIPNTNGLTTGLATLKAVQIKVVGPPPSDVQAVPTADRITVSWQKPYVCEDAADDFFFAFSIWRRIGSNPFDVDCKPGLDGQGYTKIGNSLSEQNGRYVFKDNEVERGRTYCYRVLGVFARRTDSGHPYNAVESLASEEICIQLKLDVPLLTNVSVLETATSNGVIEVKWVKPLAEDLDTLLNPGPYRYELKRATGINGTNFTTIATFNSQTFWQLNQLQYLDQAPELDTKGSPYTYKIDFFVNNESQPVGNSPAASSVWLQIEPTDNRNILSFVYNVPWTNTGFTVYRQNGTAWDQIAITPDSVYVDTGLLNGREYCYYVQSEGTYNVVGVPSPLFNLSQENCSTPIDNVAPCPPIVAVSNICNSGESCQEVDELGNDLKWNNPMSICSETDDVVSYRVYFKPNEAGAFSLLYEINESGDTTYFHPRTKLEGLVGCYAITALDTFLNESEFSNIICTDNCPFYTLPNAFTPNDDGKNELFIPYPYCFVESIDLKVFNRWGELVFTATDPNISWDGKNLNGKELADGTYYYTCRVFEQRVTGIEPSPNLLRGYIDIIR